MNHYVKDVNVVRKKMSKSKDRHVFRRTAVKSKKININPTIYRGGIRL